ncbi:hypothetical protein CUN91_00225 [Candidatus Carsonella ruddii]|uniref:Uncharacterized protein n=1 Tax=Carsonella ruddii TaxID=114186 RepID=A0A2K8K446_CARRU|nr:hypothetical protein [Candidatus Carsonella ruddii]ATX33382.1 hypothetical protein CUN91_00225 [Candidatus Carsonella ruddii]
MKYNFKKKFINNCFFNLIKFGKIKSNYFKLKKNKIKIFILLNNYFKKKIFFYLIKIGYRKGDCSLIGELGVFNYYNNNILKNDKIK